ncbi:MAG: NUDIX hydrolase [Dehalococcoidia bacterium]|nr:NUDIX hydrolase [Dehalococcoidia bacterium]
MSAFEILSAELVHTGHVFEVERASVRLPDGAVVERSLIKHPGAVALVAIDDQGRWLLVRQYRIGVGETLLEIPAGTRDDGEAPEVTAQRELREETGYAAESLERLGGTWMVPGYCDEYIHYFLASGLRPDPLDQDADEHLSEPIPMTYDEVLTAVENGEIQDAKTLAAVLLYARRQHRLRPPAD